MTDDSTVFILIDKPMMRMKDGFNNNEWIDGWNSLQNKHLMVCVPRISFLEDKVYTDTEFNAFIVELALSFLFFCFFPTIFLHQSCVFQFLCWRKKQNKTEYIYIYNIIS